MSYSLVATERLRLGTACEEAIYYNAAMHRVYQAKIEHALRHVSSSYYHYLDPVLALCCNVNAPVSLPTHL